MCPTDMGGGCMVTERTFGGTDVRSGGILYRHTSGGYIHTSV